MKLLLVCTALTVALPASLSATPEFLPTTPELLPSATSFAYTARHSTSLLPDSVTARIRPNEDNDDFPRDDVDADEPSAFAADRKIARVFSKRELCSSAVFAAEANNLPAPFFANLIQQESGFKPHVVSSAGAQGIAQFMPRVARAYGLHNPFDPIHALAVSAKFLRELLGQFGNLGLAAAAYNAGPKRVQDWMAKRGKLPTETRNYVQNITGRPAEQWVRAKVVGGDLKLPPHARCPDMKIMEANAGGVLVAATKTAAAVAQTTKSSAAGKHEPKTYNVASATETRVVIANKGGKPIITRTAAPERKVAAKSEKKASGIRMVAQRTEVSASSQRKTVDRRAPADLKIMVAENKGAKSVAKFAGKPAAAVGKRVKVAAAR